MSIWNKLWGIKNSDGTANVSGNNTVPKKYDASKYAVIDAEVGITVRKIHDIGAIRYDGAIFHKASKERLLDFLKYLTMLVRLVDFGCTDTGIVFQSQSEVGEIK